MRVAQAAEVMGDKNSSPRMVTISVGNQNMIRLPENSNDEEGRNDLSLVSDDGCRLL